MVAVQHKLTTETPDQSALMETRMLAVPSSVFHFIPDAEYVQNGELNFALLPPRDESGREAHARLEEAASLLREGNVVAVPTETVYGLAAHAMDAQAARKIFQVKQRPADNPLIVHVDGERMLHECCGLSVDPVYRPLIERFWPGPLTILLRRRTLDGSSVNADFYAELDADLDRALEAPEIPREVTQTEMVAVRLPAHPVARALITMSGLPLAAPSANRSGRPSPTLASHVHADLDGLIPMIIDADAIASDANGDREGACDLGLESTVIDALSYDEPVILRPGSITVEMVRAIPGFENTRVHRKSDLDTTLVPTTPGMKYRHYAPVNAEVVLVTSNDLSTIEADVMSHKPRSFALLHVSNECPLPFDVDMHQMCSVPISATGVTIDEYSRQIGDNLASTFIDYRISPSNTKDNTTVLGCHLFKALRWLDEYGLDIIYVPVVEEHGTGLAVMNRLYKAASRIIE